MEFIKLKLIEKIGKVFAIAMQKRQYNRYQFIQKWCSSETFQSILDFDETLCSQAKSYILRMFEKEYESNLPDIDSDSPIYDDDMYWIGYLLTYWCFEENVSGKDIIEQYESGFIDAETAVEVLNCMKIGQQICIRPEKGLENLHFIKSMKLSPEQVKQIREANRADRKMANQLTSEIIHNHNKKI